MKMSLPTNSILMVRGETPTIGEKDPVAGYTMGNIENFMKHVYGLTSLATQLKANRPNGVTNAQIDELISNF